MQATSNISSRLFSWTVVQRGGDPPDLGAVGICDDRARAVGRLSEALRDAPAGARGMVHKVTVNPVKMAYWYDDLVACAHVDQGSGAVVIDNRQPRGGWGKLGDLFDQAARAIAEPLSPDAVNAGLADLDARREGRP